MGSKTPATQTVTNETKVDPTTAAWQKALFNQGSHIYSQGPSEYYPGSTVVPYAQQTQQGLGMLQANAQQGAVGLPQAYQAQMRAMSGYNPGMGTATQASNGGMVNPYSSMIWGAANQNVAPQIYGQTQAGAAANPYTDAVADAGDPSAASGVQPYLGTVNQLAQGSSQYAPMVAQAGEQQTQMGVPQLQGFADAQNPYLDQLYQQGAEKVRNSVNAQFSGAGRTGANAAHTGALTSGLGDLYTDIYAPAYEQAQNRALTASSQLSGIDQANRAAQMSGYDAAASIGFQGANTGLQTADLYGGLLSSDYGRDLQAQSAAGSLAEQGYGRQLSAADLYGNFLNTDAARRYQGSTDLAGLSEAGFDRRLQGSELASNMWSQGNTDAARAAALLPSLYQYGEQPGQSMIGIGGAYEALQQQYTDEAVNRWNFDQNSDWDNLQRYASLMSGMPSFSSSTQTTTGGASQNRAMGALGGAASGAATGSMFGPWGTAIGAGVGGLIGLFG